MQYILQSTKTDQKQANDQLKMESNIGKTWFFQCPSIDAFKGTAKNLVLSKILALIGSCYILGQSWSKHVKIQFCKSFLNLISGLAPKKQNIREYQGKSLNVR